MKKLLLFSFAILSMTIIAQTTHSINISGTSFSPNTLTIELGDSITFTNASGNNHNVNGTQATFPSNPESFGNSLSTSWVYGFKFTVVGTYDFRCDQHFAMMTGTITVVNTNSIDEQENFSCTVFPNPTSNFITIKTDADYLLDNSDISIVLYDLTGKEVARTNNIKNPAQQISLENMDRGVYFCSIYNGNEIVYTEKVVKY